MSKMNLPLLSFPPEILVTILSFLPIRSLLRFSQTCRYSHALASSSLHSLSLGIYTTKISGILSCLSATRYPQPKKGTSAFSSGDHPVYSSSRFRSVYLDDNDFDALSQADYGNRPFTAPISIPDAEKHDPKTLLAFHCALIESILKRHGATLRNLELTLWGLTIPIAKAVASLPALRALSIRIEDFPQARSLPRQAAAMRRSEEREAWGILTDKAIWAPKLQALRIEGGELSSVQLSNLLRRSRWCQELWLCRCRLIGKDFWSFVKRDWEHGRAAMRILGVMRCGGQMDEDMLDAIGSLNDLQFLCLQGCYGLGNKAIEQRNEKCWGFAEVIPPNPEAKTPEVTTIEVDPLYMQEEE